MTEEVFPVVIVKTKPLTFHFTGFTLKFPQYLSENNQ